MGSLDRIRNVANKVLNEYLAGNKVAVVVSAMSGETNRLVGLVKDTCKMFGKNGLSSEVLPEYDAIISTGENVSAGLLAAMLSLMGYKSKSFNAWQLGFYTDNSFSSASIDNIKTDDINAFIEQGGIPIVTGFQGIYKEESRITTIGRGGSDTTAVALAAAMRADRCDIYTDVDGVYTCDPRIVKNAKKLDEIGFEEVVEMASSGAKVLHTRCIIIAMNYGVVTRVLSSFGEDNSGGTILKNDSDIMEKKVVTAVSIDTNEVQIALFGVVDRPGVCSGVFAPLAALNINVDMIVQCPSSGQSGKTDLAFTINNSDIQRAVECIETNKNTIGYDKFEMKENVSKVSVIGAGMKTHSGVAAKAFDVMSKEGINIIAISTSEIKISMLIDTKYTELAARSLHDGFGLDK